MKRVLLHLIIGMLVAYTATAQKAPYSVRMAESFMTWHKDSIMVKENKPASWDYEQGLMYKAIEKVWNRTGNGKYFEYVRRDMDRYVQKMAAFVRINTTILTLIIFLRVVLC